MGTISSVGNILLPSGSNVVNVQALLNAAESANSAPLTLLQQQQANLQTQSSTLTSIEGDVTALATAVSALNDPTGGISSLSASSSDSTILTASADSTATAQSHSITVNSLATTSSYYTDPVASGSTALATGSFNISVGTSAPVTVTVDSTNNTLDGLASAINGLNAGVTASVVNDASGARLALSSSTSGAPGDITVSNNTTGLNFNKAVTGLNASLTVDGVPINSTSNTITGVIPGVTLNLDGASPGTTVSVNVSPDTTQAQSALNTFVSAWNTVVQDFNTQFTVGSGGTNVQPLESDGTVRDAQQQLLSAITYSIGGNNGFVNLASIGLDLNDDGTMTVDSAALSKALGNNFSSVQNLLQGSSGVATYLSGVLTQLTDPTTGTLAIDLTGMSQTNQDLTNQISDMQSTLNNQNQFLTAQYDQVQVALQELPLIQSQITQQLGSLKS
jgi:flagellar hook-associated protein 2